MAYPLHNSQSPPPQPPPRTDFSGLFGGGAIGSSIGSGGDGMGLPSLGSHSSQRLCFAPLQFEPDWDASDEEGEAGEDDDDAMDVTPPPPTSAVNGGRSPSTSGRSRTRLRKTAAATTANDTPSQLGSFSALAGMSPGLGVPLSMDHHNLYGPSPAQSQHLHHLHHHHHHHHSHGGAKQQQSAVSSGVGAGRRRHFSLEDYSHDDHLHDDSSSSSTDSNNYAAPGHEHWGRQDHAGLNPIKSFMNDLDICLAEEALSLNLVDPEHSLRQEFEARLLNVCCEESRRVNQFGVEFPDGLLQVIASHVLQEASDEPYGLKGCVLHIMYEGQTALHQIGSLRCDPDTVPTFELVLTLRQAHTSWSQRMARRLSFTSSTANLAVSTTYKLVKKRKYRNNNDVNSAL